MIIRSFDTKQKFDKYHNQKEECNLMHPSFLINNLIYLIVKTN